MKDTQLKKAQMNPSIIFDFTEVGLKENQQTSNVVSNDLVATNEGYRKVRHSAAMIGLALSMGATGILLPNTDQSVLANESNGDELSLTSTSGSHEQIQETTQSKINQAVESNPVLPEYSTSNQVQATQTETQVKVEVEETVKISAPTLKHQVKEGETLWQLSQDYQVTPEAIAVSNEINPKEVIQVGETLDIPAENGIVNQEQGKQNVTTTTNVDSLLKQEQDSALTKLQQEKNELQKSLNSDFSGDEIAIITPDYVEIEVETVLEQDQAVNNLVNNNQSANQVVKASGDIATNETALNIITNQSETATNNQSTSTVIPETALLPSSNNSNQIDFHNFSEPIAIPVPLPGVQEQNLSVSKNQNLSSNSVNVTPELSEIPIPVQQPIAFAPASTSPQLYTVRQGDTLDDIAKSHGISISELMDQNNLTNPHLIKVNQQLRLPEESRQNNGFNSTITQETETLNQSNSLNSNQSLPLPTTTNFVETPNVSPNGVARMTQDVSRLTADSQNLTKEQNNNTVAFNPSSSFNQPIEIPVEPYRFVNPEWEGNVNGTSTQPTIRQTETPTQRNNQPRVTNRVQPQPEELIAAAPIATTNYNPAFQLPIGETVSPELPGLAGADQYLPSTSARFQGYMWPSKGVLTSGYGPRWGRMHRGIDIAGPIGTPIVAAAPGEVIFSGWNSGGYGNLVKIKHEDGSMTLYAHNNRLLVRTGQYVDQGQLIAEMGSTGRSTGPHLHFEVHPSGNGAVNPISMLPRR